MRTINVSNVCERLEIPFGNGAVVKCKADMRQETLAKAIEIMERTGDKTEEINKQLDAGGISEIEAEREVAEMLSELVVLVLGRETYDEIISTAGDGEDIEPHEANYPMTIIWSELCDMLGKRINDLAGSKAGHYLSEYMKYQNA